MMYAASLMSIGFAMYAMASYENSVVMTIIGILVYVFGFVTGNIIENRLEKRIEELEKKAIYCLEQRIVSIAMMVGIPWTIQNVGNVC